MAPDHNHTASPTPTSDTQHAADSGPTTRGKPVALRRNRDFSLLWSGQAISSTGSSMAAIVYPLLALTATGSATSAGVVGFVGMSVSVLVRLPSGVLADRYPLKPVMVVSDLMRVATTASIIIAILVNRVTLAQLIVATVLSALCGTAFDSAQAVAVRHVVPSEQLPNAFAQNEARGHIASLTGQPIGGFLYGISAAMPVLADALSYLASAALISLIRSPLHVPSEQRSLGPIWRDIPIGLGYVWRSAFLRITLVCAAGINIVFAGLSLVIIASQSANGTAAVHLGVAFSMGAIGGILGSWASAPIQRWLPPSALVYVFGWTATVAFVALSQARNIYIVGVLLAVVFFAATPANAMLFAVQVQVTPPELQGRVISAALLTAGIAAPLGPLLGGFLFDRTGQAPTFLTFSAMVGALTIAMHFSAAIRTMRRPGEGLLT